MAEPWGRHAGGRAPRAGPRAEQLRGRKPREPVHPARNEHPAVTQPHGHVRRAPRGEAAGRAGGSRVDRERGLRGDRKSTRLNSSHGYISYAVFCLKKKKKKKKTAP